MKILVIGGNGFIGSNIVENLLNHGALVDVYDINKFAYDGVRSYVGNIIDDDNFENILNNGGYDSVIYLITTVSPKKSMENPSSTYINDIPLLIKTLDACKDSNVKRVVFASSGGTVYGDTNGALAKEEDFSEPINHYAIGKLTCEKILELYNKLYKMENISLRISNPYGKGQNPNSGVGAITSFVDSIQNKRKISLFGDGSITRDFIAIEDVAEAFYLATLYKFNSDVSPVFNIGSGEGLSLKDIIKIIEECFGYKSEIDYLPEREFDVKYNVLDISKAKAFLGYSPVLKESEKIKKYVYDKIGKNFDKKIEDRKVR